MNVMLQSFKIAATWARFCHNEAWDYQTLLHVLCYKLCSLSELLQVKIEFLKASFMEGLLVELLRHSFPSTNPVSSFFFSLKFGPFPPNISMLACYNHHFVFFCFWNFFLMKDSLNSVMPIYKNVHFTFKFGDVYLMWLGRWWWWCGWRAEEESLSSLIMPLIMKMIILLVGGVIRLVTRESLLTSQSLGKLLDLSRQLLDLYIARILLTTRIIFAIRLSSTVACHERLMLASMFPR